jgi:hypothetical protein
MNHEGLAHKLRQSRKCDWIDPKEHLAPKPKSATKNITCAHLASAYKVTWGQNIKLNGERLKGGEQYEHCLLCQSLYALPRQTNDQQIRQVSLVVELTERHEPETLLSTSTRSKLTNTYARIGIG